MLNEHKNTLMLDEKLTSSDHGNLSYIIYNVDNASNKKLIIYGLDNNSMVTLFFSNMTDDTKNIYYISFCNEHLSPIPKLTFYRNATDPYQANLCLPNHINPGIYQGLLFIHGKNNSSIPIKVTTEPKVYVAIIWIIIGVISAIVIWELIHYFDKNKEANKKFAKRRDLTDYGKAKYHDTSLNQYVTNRFSNSAGTTKIRLIDVGTVMMGIAVGLLSSLNQAAVNQIRVFTPVDILTLIGIGLGVGSLRELFTRPKSTD
jgi:hypothetical protein